MNTQRAEQYKNKTSISGIIDMSYYVDKNKAVYKVFDEYDIAESIKSYQIPYFEGEETKQIGEEHIFINYDQNANSDDNAKQKKNIVNIDISHCFYTRLQLPDTFRMDYTKNDDCYNKRNIQPSELHTTIRIFNYSQRFTKSNIGELKQVNRDRDIFCRKVKDLLQIKLLQDGYFIDLEDENDRSLEDDTNLKYNCYLLKVRKTTFIVLDETIQLVNVKIPIKIKKINSIDSIFY